MYMGPCRSPPTFCRTAGKTVFWATLFSGLGLKEKWGIALLMFEPSSHVFLSELFKENMLRPEPIASVHCMEVPPD